MSDDRLIPLSVPAGWNPLRWASFCGHMTEACRNIRPDYAKEWAEAGEWAKRLGAPKHAKKQPLKSPVKSADTAAVPRRGSLFDL